MYTLAHGFDEKIMACVKKNRRNWEAFKRSIDIKKKEEKGEEKKTKTKKTRHSIFWQCSHTVIKFFSKYPSTTTKNYNMQTVQRQVI